MKEWQLQDAKAWLSELVRLSQTDGPQAVTVRGERAVVVISAEEYDRLAKTPFVSAAEVLLAGPEWPESMIEAIEQARSRELPHDIEP